uniref:RNA-directed DNA polymerase n=1 Tax=Glossina austeni TaxID=7395 RepID=A0A1A9VLV4_GLOAU
MAKNEEDRFHCTIYACDRVVTRQMQNNLVDVRNAKLADDNLKTIIVAKRGERVNSEQIDKESPIAKAYWANWDSLVFKDGCLWRIRYSKNGSRARNLLVIPRPKSKEIIEKYHRGTNGEHFGVMKTVKEIQRRFYWVGCRRSVAAWIHNCEESGKLKEGKKK